jgi:hypothetical protein
MPEGEHITALWLLCSKTTPAQDWRSTNVGEDIFRRTKRTQEEIDAYLGIKGVSHPFAPNAEAAR